jgi:hypothetical protein
MSGCPSGDAETKPGRSSRGGGKAQEGIGPRCCLQRGGNGLSPSTSPWGCGLDVETRTGETPRGDGQPRGESSLGSGEDLEGSQTGREKRPWAGRDLMGGGRYRPLHAAGDFSRRFGGPLKGKRRAVRDDGRPHERRVSCRRSRGLAGHPTTGDGQAFEGETGSRRWTRCDAKGVCCVRSFALGAGHVSRGQTGTETAETPGR